MHRGRDFVVTSIRVGGIGQRATDEATCIAHGVVGQETVGPAGFAMAVRTIPAMIEYGRLTARLAPGAWLVNFSNPVSVVSQAVHQHSDARSIGICDTPAEIFEDAAHALGLPPTACDYDYFGLNHLGWLREVTFQGETQMARLWDDDGRLDAAYRSPLFERERLREMRLLPTEYLYYYYRPEVALANLQKAGTSRGRGGGGTHRGAVRGSLEGRRRPDRTVSAVSGGARCQLHAARVGRDGAAHQARLGGALRLRQDRADDDRGDCRQHRRRDPLNVPNGGILPFLDDDDIIETPCVVDREGPHARPVAPVPNHTRALIACVKEYERATVQAAVSGDRDDAIAALAINPLVHSQPLAEQLVDALLPR